MTTRTLCHGLLTLILTTLAAKAQEATPPDTTWKTGGQVGVNFSQVALSNWAGGGQNTLAIAGLVNLFGNMKTEVSTWDNGLDDVS